jgi:hypothetical protein
MSFRRTLKKTVQQGRSERESETYYFRYVELLSDARTKLEVFFSVRQNAGEAAIAGARLYEADTGLT